MMFAYLAVIFLIGCGLGRLAGGQLGVVSVVVMLCYLFWGMSVWGNAMSPDGKEVRIGEVLARIASGTGFAVLVAGLVAWSRGDFAKPATPPPSESPSPPRSNPVEQQRP